jgi:ABC-type branched-subunit amino acid transport system permease subunit
MVSVVVGGVNQGVLYAFVGIGLVLIYRQSGVLNFAHGAVITVSGYSIYAALEHGLPYWVAIIAAIVVGALVNAAIELLVIRNLAQAAKFTSGIATLGVALVLSGVVIAIWGRNPVVVAPPLPANMVFRWGSIGVGANQVLDLFVLLAALVALFWLLHRTRFGLYMRSASEGPITAELLGVNVAAVRTVTWAIAGGLAGVAAVVILPPNYLDPDFPTTFMINAFAAIVLGGLESLLGVFIGAIGFGIVTSVVQFEITGQLSSALAFLATFIVLLAFPHGLLGRRLMRVPEPVLTGLTIRNRFALRLPVLPKIFLDRVVSLPVQTFPVVASALALIVSLALSQFVGDFLIFALAVTFATASAVFGQNVVFGYSGQDSIGQSGLMAIGAYSFALGIERLHIALPLALLLAMMVSGLCALILGSVIRKLSGVYLAVLTVTFVLAVSDLVNFPKALTGGYNGVQLPPPSIFGITLDGVVGPYIVVVLLTALAMLVGHLVIRSPAGRLWVAVRDSESGAESVGVNVGAKKVEAFVCGGVYAGLSGALLTMLLGFVAPDSFTLWLSIYLLVAVIVGGSASLVGSLLGAAFIVLIPIEFAKFPQVPQLALGVALVAVLLIVPEGLFPAIVRGAKRLVPAK